MQIKNKQTNKTTELLLLGNLWITPEPVRASQNHPKSPRAGKKSHPRIIQSQPRASPEPARASQSQLEQTRARRKPMKI